MDSQRQQGKGSQGYVSLLPQNKGNRTLRRNHQERKDGHDFRRNHAQINDIYIRNTDHTNSMVTYYVIIDEKSYMARTLYKLCAKLRFYNLTSKVTESTIIYDWKDESFAYFLIFNPVTNRFSRRKREDEPWMPIIEH